MSITDQQRLRQRLDSLFDKISALSNDPELMAHWARYLCVLSSGYIEQAIRLILSDFARKQSASEVASFVSNQLEAFQNPKMGKVLNLVGAFDKNWRASLERDTTGELKDAVDSIVANRHNLVHGRNVGISFVQMADYYKRAKRVVDKVAEHCAN